MSRIAYESKRLVAAAAVGSALSESGRCQVLRERAVREPLESR
jgi:hypothetical protein